MSAPLNRDGEEEGTFRVGKGETLTLILEPGAVVRGFGELDTAWAEAEAALPEGWWLDSLRLDSRTIEFLGGDEARYVSWEVEALGPRRADMRVAGPTPTAALAALAAKLREKP